MLRVGINGFGRIGRALFRNNLNNPCCEIVAINDIDSDIDNLAYLLKYDTTYGRLRQHHIEGSPGLLRVDGQEIAMLCNPRIEEAPWGEHRIDVLIDSSGVQENVIGAHEAVRRGLAQKVIVTHSPKQGLDGTFMVGVNADQYDPERHHVVSSSICDANAVAPFFKLIDDAFGIEYAEVTTLHPWLQYQNLLDGTVSSVSNPGHFWEDYALGRSSIGSMIPKNTSLVPALEAVLPGISERMHAASFRTPTSIVSAADGVFLLRQPTDLERVRVALDEYATAYPNVLILDERSKVSIDYVAVECAAVVDLRWLHLGAGRMLKFVLWYDNEWGYASRSLSLLGEILPS